MPEVTDAAEPKKPKAKAKPKAEPKPAHKTSPGDHFITTDLAASFCPRCPGLILLEGHSGGFRVQLETQPLDPAAELASILSNVSTYSLVEDRNRLQAEFRTFMQIRSDPRRKRRPLVVKLHQCERKTL